MNSLATHNVTFSPESAAGPTLCSSQAGQQLDLFGQDLALASHFPAPENNSARQTSGTYGQSSASLSASAALQRSLASRLQVRLGVIGSMEYELTWKQWSMQSGPPICALRARRRNWRDGSGFRMKSTEDHGFPSVLVRRTSGKGCIGWQTPTVQDGNGRDRHNQRNGTVILSLLGEARIAGWPTPDTNQRGGPQDPKKRKLGGHSVTLQDAALGENSTSSPAPTEKRGALNPDLPPLAHGVPARVVRVRGYGNAIVPQVATEFIKAFNSI